MSEAQQRIISAIVADRTTIKKCPLLANDFTDESMAMIYQAATELLREQVVVDLVTLSTKLKDMTGDDWFTSLATYAKDHLPISDDLFVRCCDIIKNEKIQREIKIIASEALENEAVNSDLMIKKLMQLTQERNDYSFDLKQTVSGAIDQIEAAVSNGKPPGVDVGYSEVNYLVGGFNNSDLIIIGARPAMGKTALMINFALRANEPVGIISSEQGREQIGQRILAITSRVPVVNMRSGNLDDLQWKKLTNAVARISDRQIFINDEPRITVEEVARQARKWKFNHNIKALYIDYLQRIDCASLPKTAPKHERIGEIAKSLKSLAKELDIPVIALSQVNRDVEKNQDKRPKMGNLSDSSEIEKEADVIAFLYRDEVYNEDSPDVGIAELIFEKNRHGSLGTARLAWLAPYLTFEDISNVRHYA